MARHVPVLRARWQAPTQSRVPAFAIRRMTSLAMRSQARESVTGARAAISNETAGSSVRIRAAHVNRQIRLENGRLFRENVGL